MPMDDKKKKYQDAFDEIDSLLSFGDNLISGLSNVCAVLKSQFNFWWVGFYLVQRIKEEDSILQLGPFQGPVACQQINFGKGVCGTSWKEKKTVLVPNVHEFPGHIACSESSNSEIVVPIMKNAEVAMILDVDSEHFNHFDSTDQEYLEMISELISKKLLSAK